MRNIQGSKPEDVNILEASLGFKLPVSLKEYLLLLGGNAYLYSIWDYHGTKDILELKGWIYDWIEKYRREGIDLRKIDVILPFFK